MPRDKTERMRYITLFLTNEENKTSERSPEQYQEVHATGSEHAKEYYTCFVELDTGIRYME